MTDICFGLLLSLLFLASAWGWGQALNAFVRVPLLRLGAFATVTGLALLAFLGGILNLAGVAKPYMLAPLILFGVVLAVVKVVRARPGRRTLHSASRATRAHRVLLAVPVAVACGAAVFVSACLMPTSIFNFHDDFHTYLPRVIRMLESGSVAGNPFDGMGIDSLGTQTFFQGFFVALGGPRMANGFDAVCCFFLTLLLVAQCARAWRLPIYLRVLAVLTVAIITPQYVNISPLYSSALTTLALVVWGSALAKQLFVRGGTRRGMECAGALLIALLLSLKLTVATFAALYLAILYTILFFQSARRVAVIKSAAMTAVLAGVFVLPWALAHWPTIQHARELTAVFRDQGLLPTANPSIAAHDIPKLFSFRPLYYGDSVPAFDFLALTSGVAAILAVWLWRRKKIPAAGLLSVISAGLTVVGIYFLNAHMFAFDTAVRYSVPVLIGCFVALLLCLSRFSRVGLHLRRVNYVSLGAAALMLIAMAIFAKTFSKRVWLAMNERRAFTFSVNAAYLSYCRETFSREDMARSLAVQQKTPPGSTILAWTATPFHLDFARNELMTVNSAGLVNPALHFPLDFTSELFVFFLQQWKIQYVLIDVTGFGIKDMGDLMWQVESEDVLSRKLAERGLYLRRVLATIGRKSEIIYADKRTVLFKLPLPDTPKPGTAAASAGN